MVTGYTSIDSPETWSQALSLLSTVIKVIFGGLTLVPNVVEGKDEGLR